MPVTRERSWPCMPTCTFSIDVIVRNSLMFWNVRAMPALVTRSARLAVMSCAVEDDPAGRRPVEAGEAVEERRLARAVRADERDDRLLGHAERDVVDRDEAAEDLRDVRGLEQGAAAAVESPRRAARCAARSCLAHLVDWWSDSAPMWSDSSTSACSSSLRLDDGRKPSGRSTIITSRKKPKIPKLIDVTSKSRPSLSGMPLSSLQQVAVHQRQHDRAEHHAPDVAHAADDDHAQDEDREAELELVDVDRVVVGRRGTRRRSRRARRRSRRPTASCARGSRPSPPPRPRPRGPRSTPARGASRAAGC